MKKRTWRVLMAFITVDAVIALAMLVLNSCSDYPPPPPNGVAYSGQSKELVVLIDSVHRVVCYRRAYSSASDGLSCLALDSLHWFPRVERTP